MMIPKSVLRSLAVASTCLLLACGSAREPASEQVTVEGSVTVRGNEPFSAYVLETGEHNLYVLRFEDAPPSTPAFLVVTGELYQANWNGRPYAHIDVQAFQPSQ